MPPPSHQPHPGHHPAHHHHDAGDQPWIAGAGTGRTRLTRSGRDPRVTGAALVVAFVLVILLLAIFA